MNKDKKIARDLARQNKQARRAFESGNDVKAESQTKR